MISQYVAAYKFVSRLMHHAMAYRECESFHLLLSLFHFRLSHAPRLSRSFFPFHPFPTLFWRWQNSQRCRSTFGNGRRQRLYSALAIAEIRLFRRRARKWGIVTPALSKYHPLFVKISRLPRRASIVLFKCMNISARR